MIIIETISFEQVEAIWVVISISQFIVNSSSYTQIGDHWVLAPSHPRAFLGLLIYFCQSSPLRSQIALELSDFQKKGQIEKATPSER